MRKNILIFCHGYADGFIACNNQYTKLFDKDSYEVTVVYLSGESNEPARKRHISENVIFLNVPKKEKRGLKWLVIKKMLQLHREKHFEIVICHRYKPTYVMLWVAQFRRIPALFLVMHEMQTLKSFSRKILIAALAKKNMIFAGVSNSVRDDMRRDIWQVPPERIITLYNMIDVDLIEPQLLSRSIARQQLNLDENLFVFGILARLAKAKDHATLLKGFALAKPYCPNAKLLIIGDGELKATIQAQINQFGLNDDVVLAGFLPKAFSLLKALDVFVLTSVKEAFGRVLLESMIAKVPIIATKTHGIPEVVGDVGELIDPMNPTQLAEKLIAAYNLPKKDLTSWNEKSYQRVVKEFSIPRFKEIFWELSILK